MAQRDAAPACPWLQPRLRRRQGLWHGSRAIPGTPGEPCRVNPALFPVGRENGMDIPVFRVAAQDIAFAGVLQGRFVLSGAA